MFGETVMAPLPSAAMTLTLPPLMTSRSGAAGATALTAAEIDSGPVTSGILCAHPVKIGVTARSRRDRDFMGTWAVECRLKGSSD